MQHPESTKALQSIIQHAAAHTTPLRLVGNGTWLTGSGPFVDSSRVSLRTLRGITQYEPGDLVITVGAGTTLDELAHATTPHGQMFAAAPYGTNDSTIGACIATASPAPLALGDLGVRDLVLGLTVVTGTGEVVRGGGRVVKNVAGFDLVRLHTGACGTLGAITEVTLRLHAIPQVDAIVVGTLEQDLAHSLPTLVANRAPLPMLLHLAPGKAPELWARVSGNSARAAALTNRLAAFGITGLSHVADTTPLRTTSPTAVVLRARTALSDAAPLVAAARSVFPAATLQYDPARGSLRVLLEPRDNESVPVASLITHFTAQCRTNGAVHDVSVIVEQGRLVAHERTPIEVGLKRAMDPHDVLNRLLADHVA